MIVSSITMVVLETSDDSKQYNNSSLGRCSEENAFIKIKSQMDLKINDKEDKYHAAAMRLNILLVEHPMMHLQSIIFTTKHVT